MKRISFVVNLVFQSGGRTRRNRWIYPQDFGLSAVPAAIGRRSRGGLFRGGAIKRGRREAEVGSMRGGKQGTRAVGIVKLRVADWGFGLRGHCVGRELNGERVSRRVAPRLSRNSPARPSSTVTMSLWHYVSSNSTQARFPLSDHHDATRLPYSM